MSDLLQKHCEAYKDETGLLADTEIVSYLRQVPVWAHQANTISRTYGFRNYYETIAFVNALAEIAHREDHHPDLHVGYKTCEVVYTTHSVGGLSLNDFICAAKIDALHKGS